MDFIQACAQLQAAPPKNRRPPTISVNGGFCRYCFASDDRLYRLTDDYAFAPNSSPRRQEILSGFWQLDLGEDYNDSNHR